MNEGLTSEIVPECETCRWWLVYNCPCVPPHCRRMAQPGREGCHFQPKPSLEEKTDE
jgi:hypothetical protein